MGLRAVENSYDDDDGLSASDYLESLEMEDDKLGITIEDDSPSSCPRGDELPPAQNGRGVAARGKTVKSRRLDPAHMAPLRSISLALCLVGLFPFFPALSRTMTRGWRFALISLLVVLTFVYASTNFLLVRHNLILIQFYKFKFGLMHSLTVSNIVSGIKPLVNLSLMLIFFLKTRSHLHLLRTSEAISRKFARSFGCRPPPLLYCFLLVIGSILAFIPPLVGMILEEIFSPRGFGGDLLSNARFFLVPMLSLWPALPLIYYHASNLVVRFYCRVLLVNLAKRPLPRTLRFFYRHFLKTTQLQEAIGDFFNPFVLFSLAWSLVILCLTIYFITVPTSSLFEPINATQVTNVTIRQHLDLRVRFSVGWAALQVLLAITYIATICSTGMATNELTRQISNAVLKLAPAAKREVDRFQISCFVHKTSTQFVWGMTVWRAFPLERATFFTLVSAIITYSFLLLKLRDNPAVAPVMRAVVICSTSNSTGPGSSPIDSVRVEPAS